MIPKNKSLSLSAKVSLVVVILATIAACLCYVIAPDQTPNANRQIPQIALLKAAASQKFYPNKILNQKDTPFIKHIISGKPSDIKYIPFDSISAQNNTVEIIYGKQVTVLPKTDNMDIIQNVITKHYLLGTDKYGRDVLSRLIVGLRVSLFVGLFAVIISVIIGCFFGLISGYYGGWVDKIAMTIINVNWSIPTLLLAFAILLVMDRGLTAIYLAIGFTLWVDLARIIRGQVMEIRSKEYVLAAKTMGISSGRIMIKHILPNLYGTILVIASINFATAILVEAGLSYLGLGVQPPVPSLGNMLKENYGYVTSGHIVLSVAPATVILTLVLAFNLLGNGLRDYYDIKR